MGCYSLRELLDMSFFSGNNQPEAIPDDSVSTVKIQDNAITKVKMADNSVGTDEIEINAITNDEMADNAINTSEIVNNAVTQDKMADNSVGTAELIDGSITPAKFATIGNDFTVKGQWMKIAPGAGTGVLSGYFTSAATAGTVTTGYKSGDEHGIEFVMNVANEAGGLVPLFANLFTDMNITIVIRWTVINNASDSDNLWLGLVGNLDGDKTNSAFPDTNNVFIFGKKNGETNWGVIRNDGTGTATKSNTVAYNTIVNKTIITTTSTTLTLKHNSNAAVAFTTDIPASTTPLALIAWVNAESGTEKTFRVLDVDIEYDFKTGA